MRKQLKILVMVTAVLLMATIVKGDTIYNNLGPGGTVFAMSGQIIDRNFAEAVPFTVGAGSGFNLTQIAVGISTLGLGGTTNGVIVQLLQDSGGLPGAFIRSWTLTNLPDLSINTSLQIPLQPSQMITGIRGITLAGGTQYWVVALPIDTTGFKTFMSWDAGTDQGGPNATSNDNGNTWTFVPESVPGGLEVLGTKVVTATPEPGSLLLSISGLAGILAVRRNGKKDLKEQPVGLPAAETEGNGESI